VSRSAKRAHVVGDLPFMSYQSSIDEAVKNAGRMIAEGRRAQREARGRLGVRRRGEGDHPGVDSGVWATSGSLRSRCTRLGGYVVQGPR